MLLLLFWNNDGSVVVDDVIEILGGLDYLVTHAAVGDSIVTNATVTDELAN